MLTVERDAGVITVTLNRPEFRNAFNAELIAEITHALKSTTHYDLCMLIRGAGEAFCAGGDLNWMRQQATQAEAENRADAEKLFDMFTAIVECPLPVIAYVQGACFGGGCGIVAASDIVIAAEDAKFAFSEVKLGLVPATISPFVKAKIGSAARELFVTGSVFDATHALRIGLVNRIGTAEDATAVIKSIIANGPNAVRTSKLLAIQEPLCRDRAAHLLAEVRASREAKEGIAAFLEKRKPNFGGQA